MDTFWETYLISQMQMLLALLKTTVKNEASKAKLKKSVLIFVKTAFLLWADDPDFEALKEG